MKIAILFFGRLNKCKEHYDNIFSSIGKDNTIDTFMSSDNSPKELLDTFVELYKPISYINDKIEYTYDLTIYPGRREEVNFHNMICHFTNKYRVFSLLENHINSTNTTYDIIVSLRLDLVYQSNFNLHIPKQNTVYIPQGYDYLHNAVNDQIAYGTYETMKIYNSLILNMITLLDKGLTIPHPESLVFANLKYNCVEIERFNLSYFIER